MTDYITTSIPYVNARPHIGHALELVEADALARYRRLCDGSVVLQTGTDENAHKNVSAAREIGVSVRQLVDENAEHFRRLVEALGIRVDSFIRTTEERHTAGVRAFWSAIDTSDLLTRRYRGLYCEGCEEFLRESDLENGLCPDHLIAPETVEEENYFFRLSRYAETLERIIETDRIRIIPATRKREVLAFIRAGLVDISISRNSARLDGWGIAVPDDDQQTIYVWIDALINYLSGIGYGSNHRWQEIWNCETQKTHVIGKNVWKFHAIYWPALLLSAELPLPDTVIIHGFLTVNGQKISKSLGTTVDPVEELSAVPTPNAGADPLRLWLLSTHPFRDGDYSRDSLVSLYNSVIAGSLGSTATRIAALCERLGFRGTGEPATVPCAPAGYHEAWEAFRPDRAFGSLLAVVESVNKEVALVRPWEATTGDHHSQLRRWVQDLQQVAYWTAPFVPLISKRLQDVLCAVPLEKPQTLFPRLPKLVGHP